MDPQKYRVTLICKCKNDYVEGFGPTEHVARAVANMIFWKNHGRRAKPLETHLDRVSDDGSHYESI